MPTGRRDPALVRRWLRSARDAEQLFYAPGLRLAREEEQPPSLPARVGLVVRGLPSRSAASWIALARERHGDRALLFEELFPDNHDPRGDALALNLGPVRRDAAFARSIDAYALSPMPRYLAASRLALESAAAFVDDPASYDADRVWKASIARIAGEDREARRALDTQATEWGGFIGERNYRPYTDNRPESVHAELRDPAASAAYRWVTRRYAERIHAMRTIEDAALFEELSQVMRRRLAIARAVPVVRQLTLGQGPRDDLSQEQLLDELARQRRELRSHPDALAAFERFVALCGLAQAIPSAAPER